VGVVEAITIDDAKSMSEDNRKKSFASLLAVMPMGDVSTVLTSVLEEDDLDDLAMLMETEGVAEIDDTDNR